MKKHEACYWLNEIIRDQRNMLVHYEKGPAAEYRDPVTGETKTQTEKELESQKRWYEEQTVEHRSKIEALDIAAASLTK